MGSIRLGGYFEQRVNYEQPVLFTSKDFYNFRNHVLRVLRLFGSVHSIESNGGEGGIRTHGTVSRTLAFEASTLNRSVTSPRPWQF